MAKGGAGPARKGARFEALVVADQRRQGRTAYRLRQGGGCPVRQGGGCPVDVVSFQRLTAWARDSVRDAVRVLFIQAKVRGVISQSERAALLAESVAAGALALLAFPGGPGIVYEEIAP
jgi:hypothetical protein